jgi:hypothetical protein
MILLLLMGGRLQGGRSHDGSRRDCTFFHEGLHGICRGNRILDFTHRLSLLCHLFLSRSLPLPPIPIAARYLLRIWIFIDGLPLTEEYWYEGVMSTIFFGGSLEVSCNWAGLCFIYQLSVNGLILVRSGLLIKIWSLQGFTACSWREIINRFGTSINSLAIVVVFCNGERTRQKFFQTPFRKISSAGYNKNSAVYTRGVLAKRFDVTQAFVGQVAALKKTRTKEANGSSWEAARKEQREVEWQTLVSQSYSEETKRNVVNLYVSYVLCPFQRILTFRSDIYFSFIFPANLNVHIVINLYVLQILVKPLGIPCIYPKSVVDSR